MANIRGKLKQNMYVLRGFLVWLIIVVAESIHGTIRQLFLAPVVGDFTARRISFFVAVLLIFLITYFSVRWINAPTVKSLFVVGLIWTVLMTLFEFGLGIFVMNYSWERMFEDYDLSRGGLMGFGLLFMFFAPFLAVKIRVFRKAEQEI